MSLVLALCAEGTGQTDRRGVIRDTNMWKCATQVADRIVHVSGVGVNQSLSKVRMATGWGAAAKALQIVEGAREILAKSEEPPIIIGFGGSRGVAVLLRACADLAIPIHAVCLFDAVYSFGLFFWDWLDKKLWPYEVPGNIFQALHIVALHEDTPGFEPVIFPERDGLLQVSCQGDHSEILRGSVAERIALSWLDSIGIPKRFEAPSNGWGEPTRGSLVQSLPPYWSAAPPSK